MTKLATEKLVDEHMRVDEEDLEGQPIPNFSGTGGLIKPAENLVDPTVNPEDEIISERTERTKTYDMGDGKRRTIAASPKAHYKNNPSNPIELYKEVNLTLQEESDRYTLPQKHGKSTAPFELAIYKHQIGYILEDKNNGTVSVQLDQIADTNIDSDYIEENVIISSGGNAVYWSIPELGVSVRVVVQPEKVETWKTIQNENAAREFKWIVEETKDTGDYKFRPDRVDGHDNAGDQVEVHDDTKIIEEYEDFIRYEHTEQFTGRAAKIDDPETRSRSWQSAKYPVEIDPSTSKDITANIDDVTTGEFGYFSSDELHVGYAGGSEVYGGVRFRSLGISQGVTISSATLQGYLTQTALTAYVYGDDVDNAPQWSSSDRPEDITKTSNKQTWVLDSTGSTQTGVTGIVQDIVSRSGWSSGNALRMAMIATTTPGFGDQGFFEDYSDDSPDVATLSVTWSSTQRLSTIYPPKDDVEWITTTADVTADFGEGYLVDASSNSVTVTLPSSPRTGDVVAVFDYTDSAGTNDILISGNGNNIDGSTDDLKLDVNGAGIRLVYTDDTQGWKIISEIN